MRFDDMLDDSKPQAAATNASRAILVDTVEPLEDAVEILRWNADAGIPYPDLRERGAGLHLDSDASVGTIVLDGVLDQIGHHLLQTLPVAENLAGDVADDYKRECDA